MSKELPEWFEQALENTRRSYARINVLNQQCPFCGCSIHLATGWRDEPKQKEGISISDYRAEVYPFCACAQGAGDSERLLFLARHKADWWPRMAAWYHRHIARADSEQHRANMLQGYPHVSVFSKYVIDPNQDLDE